MANAELARRVLDAIWQNPEAFDMDTWHDSVDETPLDPNEDPSCGTTMCVAGWTAHLTGWRVWGSDASKDGVQRDVDDVAADALGLSKTDTAVLFYSTPWRAIEILEEMAS